MLLVSTLIPMYWLQQHYTLVVPDGTIPEPTPLLFQTPVGAVSLPLSIVVVVLGREAFMTLFRQIAARRGLVIAAIGPAKWKTTFQSIWIGAAYCWFFAATLAATQGWETQRAWQIIASCIGVIGVVSMVGAVVLTLWSLWLYLHRYGKQVVQSA
jgi:phosphatidylglycerophosphate synthase